MIHQTNFKTFLIFMSLFNSSDIRHFTVFVLCVTSFGVTLSHTIKTSEHFNNSIFLDNEGKYKLFWNFNDTRITFEVHVETRCYVGFGISPNGKMISSDVVIGWVKNGVTHFSVSKHE